MSLFFSSFAATAVAICRVLCTTAGLLRVATQANKGTCVSWNKQEVGKELIGGVQEPSRLAFAEMARTREEKKRGG